MKIGVFDSGLGGLYTMKGIARRLPVYDYVYLGDTKRLPYGNRSHEVIYEFLKEGIEFLFAQKCLLVIVACNTASAQALCQLQQEYLPKKFPDRKVLGVIVPTVETCVGMEHVGVIATGATVSSGTYEYYFKKLSPGTRVTAASAPLLVPLIENDGIKWVPDIAAEYMRAFKDKKLDALILGCTHYPIIEKTLRKHLDPSTKIICQNKVIPVKIADYLDRHPEIQKRLSKKSVLKFFVTDMTPTFQKKAKEWFGEEIQLKKVSVEK